MQRASDIMVTPLILLWLLLNKCEHWCNVIYYALKLEMLPYHTDRRGIRVVGGIAAVLLLSA